MKILILILLLVSHQRAVFEVPLSTFNLAFSLAIAIANIP